MKSGALVGTGLGVLCAHQMYKYMIGDQSSIAHASVTASHNLYGWGSCSKGQIGIGREVNVLPIPTIISDLEGQ